MIRKAILTLLLGLALTVLSSGLATAGILGFTDQNQFNSALAAAGLTTTSITLTPRDGWFYNSGYTQGYLTIGGNTTAYSSAATSPLYGNQNFLYGAGLTTISILSSANLYAIWFNYGCTGSNCNQANPEQITATNTADGAVTLVNVSNYVWPSSTTSMFYGIVSTSPLTQISIGGNIASFIPNIAVGNFNVATGSAAGTDTPEASTMALIGAGLSAIAALRRRARATA